MTSAMIVSAVGRPTFWPVSVEEAMSWLGIDAGDREADLMSALLAATEEVGARVGAVLHRRTFKGVLDAWPCEGGRVRREIRLPRNPAVALTSIRVFDADGVAETVSPGDYLFVPTYDEAAGDTPEAPFAPGRIVLKSGASWPTVGQEAAGIEIVWEAGLPESAVLPERIRSAILLLTKHLFDDETAEAEPPGVNDLIRNLRPWNF